MSDQEVPQPSRKKFDKTSRKTIVLSQEALVKSQSLLTGTTLPLVMQPAVDGLDPVGWTANNREMVARQLLNNGGILFRNFKVQSVAVFEQFIRAISGELLEYSYRSTPRSHVSGQIYTSTEYPADQSIPLHNEMSYSSNWPMKIWFFCVQCAEKGGETPIAENRRVFNRIPPSIREEFIQKKVMYVRNYGAGLDLPWQDVFQATSRADVEKFCSRAGIEYEWKSGDRLKTRQICQAVARHPETGEMVWFNQAHLFHVSNLQPQVRESLLSEFEEEDLPRNAYYGDGSPIETSMLDEIRRVYQQEAVIFPWKDGDILMLDNMLAAHGRAPFEGPRKVVVGMAEPFNNQDI